MQFPAYPLCEEVRQFPASTQDDPLYEYELTRQSAMATALLCQTGPRSWIGAMSTRMNQGSRFP